MRSPPPSRYLAFFAIAIAGFSLDLATKRWIFATLGLPGEQEVWWLWQDVFGFQTSLNEGALFGIGQGRTLLFAVMSVAAAGAIFTWLFVAGASRDWLLTIACGFVSAGIFGNLYDRLGLPGLRWNYANSLHEVGDQVFAVRDWILVMIGRWPWPTFNLADSMLVVGAALITIHVIWLDAGAKKPDREQG